MLQEKFLTQIKRTVGYAESENKSEFLKGAEVAFNILSAAHKKSSDSKDRIIEKTNEAWRDVHDDICKLSEIIKKYS